MKKVNKIKWLSKITQGETWYNREPLVPSVCVYRTHRGYCSRGLEGVFSTGAAILAALLSTRLRITKND